MRIAWLFLFLPALASAETAYVTDNLRLGLHRAEDTSDRAFRTLESGQALEILARDSNFAQVRLPDGETGYVKVAYLVLDKPAKLILAETLDANDALQQELENLRQSLAEPANTISRLEQEVGELQSRLDESGAHVDSLAAENESYRRRSDQYRNSLPLTWVVGAMSVCLLAGFLVGIWWIDLQSRRRHGGIRIY